MPRLAESALEAARIGAWDLDVATGLLRWTATVRQILEIDRLPRAPLERALAAFPPLARPIIEAALRNAVGTGAPCDLEVPFVTPGGREIWLRVRGQAVRDGGRTTRLRGVLEDDTARRAELAECLRAEGMLRDVLETLPTAVTAYDPEDCLLLANKAAREMFPITARFAVPGRKRAEAMRMAVEHGQFSDAPTDPDALAAWIADRVTPKLDGAPRDVRLKNGRVIQSFERRSGTGRLVMARVDITSLHAAEERALREAAERQRAEALLRDVLDTLPNAVIAFDASDRVALINRAYAEIYPIAARFATPGRDMEEMFRLAAELGQYADAPADPAAFDGFIAMALNVLRTGVERAVPLADGRVMQMRGRRSDSGNLVSVRTDVTDLTRAEALLRDILETLPSAVIAYDRDERLVLWNSAAAELMPMTARHAVRGRTLEEMLSISAEFGQIEGVPTTPEGRARWVAEQAAIYRAGSGERTVRFGAGRYAQARERKSESGNLVCVRTDTTELTRAQTLLRDVLDALPSAVTAYDADERLILINRAYGEMFPIAFRFTKIGARVEDVLRQAAEHGQFPESGDTPESRAAWLARRLHAHRNPGAPRTVVLPGGRYLRAHDTRTATGVTVSIRTDTTDLVRAESKMRLQAEHDTLTGLANRRAFLAALERVLAAQGGRRRTGGALLLLDVDYFKQINDTLGHDSGDALLSEIASRLRGQLRDTDVPARLGGDEFGVVMAGLPESAPLSDRLDRLHAALSVPVAVAGRLLPIGVSIGATRFPADGIDAARLLKNADLALYEAKRNGRGRWAAFRPDQAEALDARNRLADALRDALARRRITVAFQPKRRLRGGAHAGFEALARWHDGGRWVPPLDFVPVAEQTGLINPLGRAVLEAAVTRVREIRDLGLDPGRVAVNVTGPQLVSAHFKEETLALLRRHRLRPAHLELEVTETVLLGRAAERIDAVLRELSAAGVTLALDDFGTGYASLAHLSRLPIDRLKIDRSFVDGIAGGGPGGVIARTIISLARSLEMESVAEGVETEEQMAFLEAAGCDAAQGFLFSKPLLTTEEAVAYLKSLPKPAAAPRRHAARMLPN